MVYKLKLSYSNNTGIDLNEIIDSYQRLGVPLEIKTKGELLEDSLVAKQGLSEDISTAIKRKVFDVEQGVHRVHFPHTAVLNEKQDLDDIKDLFKRARRVSLECMNPNIQNLVEFLKGYDTALHDNGAHVKKEDNSIRISFNEESHLRYKQVPAPEWACIGTFFEAVE